MPQAQPMTEAMYYILLSLLQPGHGYGMIARIRELSGGRVEMGPGTLYGVLTRMKEEGLIVLASERSGARPMPSPKRGSTPCGSNTGASSTCARRRRTGGTDMRRYLIHPGDYAIGENEKCYGDMAAKGWKLRRRALF